MHVFSLCFLLNYHFFKDMSFLNEVPEAGDYLFHDELKSGVLSGCWRAYSKNTNQYYIIKTVQKESFNTPESGRKFIHELGLIRNAHHENVSQFIEMIDQPSQVHIVMSDVNGVCLRDYIESNGPMNERLTAELIARLYVVSQYLKPQLGIEYCSFNVDNVFVDNNGHLTYYFLQQFNGLLNHSESASTIPFHPPEVISGKGYNTNADSWSLAAIAHFCLTGEILFLQNSIEATKKAVLAEPLKINEKISDEAKYFITKGMIKNPLMRTAMKNFITFDFLKDAPIDITQSMPVGISESPSKLSLHDKATLGKKSFIKLSYKSSISMARKVKNVNKSETMFW